MGTVLSFVLNMLSLPFGERWEVYVANGDYPGQWPKWYTTKTRWGAKTITRRLNNSKFAEINQLVFSFRRRGAL